MPAPSTSILDAFTRADSGTLGASWGTNVHSGWPTFAIVTNAASNGASAFHSNYWATSLGADQEAYCTVTSTDMPKIICRMSNPGASPNYYEFSYDGAGNAYLIKQVSGIGRTQMGSNIFITINVGDSIGIQAQGSTVRAYHKPSAGAWTLVGERTDSDIPNGGFIGFTASGAALVTLDDFGGGTLSSGASVAGVPRFPVLDDFNRSDGGLGANWTLSYVSAGFRVLSNQLAPPAVAAWVAMYFNTILSGEHEIFATFAVVPALDNHYCYLELHLDTATANGYYIEFDSDYLGLGKTVSGVATLLATTPHDENNVIDGDTFGLRIDGDDVVAWRIRSGVVAEIHRVTDTSHRPAGMYRYLEIADIATEVRVDNFGGGVINNTGERQRVRSQARARAVR